jgi:uncharacterized protein (DUF934 family)
MPTLKLRNGRLAHSSERLAGEISHAEWRDGARPEGGRFALALPNDIDVGEVAPTLGAFAVVILEFPTFKDGRAYSQARLLRERFGYRGEIRARGEVLRDQAFFMARAGIDAFEVEDSALEGFSAALGAFSHVYQASADGAVPVWRRRLSRAEAA